MELTVRFGRALHRFGASADQLEAAMAMVARRVGLHGEFFASPTAIHAAFGHTPHQRAVLVRVPVATEVDLTRLGQLDRLARRVGRGGPSVARELDAILAAPPRHGPLAVAVGFALASGSAARILGGGAAEVAVALGLGVVLGAAMVTLGGRPRLAPLLPTATALVAAAGAGGAASWGLTQAPWTVTLAALIVLVPGLTLTLAMREIASGHLASGSARLTGALATFLALGCGIALGDQLASAVVGNGILGGWTSATVPLPAWTRAVAVLSCAVALVPLFQARRSDLPSIVLGCAVAVVGSRLGDAFLDARLAPLVGATLLGATGNAVARLRDSPAAPVVVPGLLLLVPGSMGASSLSAMLAGDVVGGISTAFAMAFVAAALVGGLLLANLVVAPRSVV